MNGFGRTIGVSLAAALLMASAAGQGMAQSAGTGSMPMMQQKGGGMPMMQQGGASATMPQGGMMGAQPRAGGPQHGGQGGMMGRGAMGGGMMMGGMMRQMMKRMMGGGMHGFFRRARPLTAEEVRRVIDGRLAMWGLSKLRADKVQVKDGQAEADIRTAGGEKIMRLRIDRMSGRMSIIE